MNVAIPVLRTIGLCAGVGMLDEGLHTAFDDLGIQSRAVGYVERDAFAAASLLARMEEQSLEPAPVWAGNLEDVRWESWHGSVDFIVAGFPCQPWSAAGQQKGTDDARWIWPAIADAVRRSGAWGVALENVRGLVSGGGLDPVLGELADMGFVAQWGIVSAASVGASHRRERIFILATKVGYAGLLSRRTEQREQPDSTDCRIGESSQSNVAVREGRGLGELRESSGGDGFSERGDKAMADPQSNGHTIGGGQRNLCEAHGRPDGGVFPEHSGASGAMANASSGQFQESRRGAQGRNGAGSAGEDMADPCQPRREGRELGELSSARGGDEGRTTSELCHALLFAPGPADPRWGAILARNPGLAPSIEPGFCVLVDGLAVTLDESRADQLRCAGNGVVALEAAAAFVELAERLIKT